MNPTPRTFPSLDSERFEPTRCALHQYSKILGDVCKATRPKRKHWWHASLRPSLRGLTTLPIRLHHCVELELDLVNSELHVTTPDEQISEPLRGQSAQSLADWVRERLEDVGIPSDLLPRGDYETEVHDGYCVTQSRLIQDAVASVSAELAVFRAGIREETSPIQVWPHHFDLSMIWLPGDKIPDQDPANEEYADKQMNFGFVLADESQPDPYFYVTAYPSPESLSRLTLPAGARWKSDGFTGAILNYCDLIALDDPASELQSLWTLLKSENQKHLSSLHTPQAGLT